MIKRYPLPVAMMTAGSLLLLLGTATGLPIRVPGMTIALAGLIVVCVIPLSKKLSEIRQLEARQLALAQADEILKRPIDRRPAARRHRGNTRRPPRCRHRRDGGMGMGLAGGIIAIPAVVGGWLVGQARDHALQTSVAAAAVTALPVAGLVTNGEFAQTSPITVTEVIDSPAATIVERVVEEKIVIVEKTQLVTEALADEPEPEEPEPEPAGVLIEPVEPPEPVEQPSANPEPEPEPVLLEETAEPQPEPTPEPEPVPTMDPEPDPTSEPDPTVKPTS